MILPLLNEYVSSMRETQGVARDDSRAPSPCLCLCVCACVSVCSYVTSFKKSTTPTMCYLIQHDVRCTTSTVTTTMTTTRYATPMVRVRSGALTLLFFLLLVVQHPQDERHYAHEDMVQNMFRSFFGGGFGGASRGPRRPTKMAPIALTLHVPLKDLYMGASKKLQVTRYIVCSKCHGYVSVLTLLVRTLSFNVHRCRCLLACSLARLL